MRKMILTKKSHFNCKTRGVLGFAVGMLATFGTCWAEQPQLMPPSSQASSSYTPGSSRIKTNGARILLDGFGEFTEPLQLDRYLEFVGISTPTVTLRSNHADLWLNNSTKQLCTRFDDSSSGCLALGSAITGQFLVSPSTGLIGGVFASNLILSNQVSLSSGVTGSLPAASIAAGSLGSSVITSSLAVNSVYPGAVRPGVYSIAVSSAQFLYNQVSPSTGIANGTLAAGIILGNQVSLSTGVTGSLPAASIAAGTLGANVIASSVAYTAAVLNSNTLVNSTTFYVSSGTATNMNTTTLKFADGTSMTTAPSGTGHYFNFASTTSTTAKSTTSGTYQQTNLVGTITSVSSSHKVIVSVSADCADNNEGTTNLQLTVFRNGTDIDFGTAGLMVWGGATTTAIGAGCSFMVVDTSPASGSNTYAVYIKSNGGASVTFGNGDTSLIMEEVN